MWSSLLAIALAPGFAIVVYTYWRDRSDREPLKHLAASFFLGVLSAPLAVLIDKILSPLQTITTPGNSVGNKLFTAFVLAALVEESCKLFMCRLYAYPKPEFNEPLDGIVYMVMVAMGFATVENVLYVFQDPQMGMQTGILRMFLAVPGHACWGAVVGYFLGLAKFKKRFRSFYIFLGLAIGVLLHGSYDAALFLQQADGLAGTGYVLLLTAGALTTAVLSYLLAFLAIRRHRKISRELFPEDKNAPTISRWNS